MSTPPEPGQSAGRRAIEPTHVQRRRRTEALAELIEEVRRQQYGADPDGDYETVAVPVTSAKALSPAAQEETEELPPVPGGEPSVPGGEDYTRDVGPSGVAPGPTSVAPGPAGAAPGPSGTASRAARRTGRARRTGHVPVLLRGSGVKPRWGRPAGQGRRPTHGQDHAPGRGHADGAGRRRAAIAIGVSAAALAGFALALLVPGDQDGRARAGQPGTGPAATAAAPAGSADPDGAGTLREGDSGPEVAALQRRLLRVPDVYAGGSTDGGYDATLTAAVARFQLWYGIRGDETGVYGDDTRAALESRTTP
ncbi:peptidoglycan-binding protein [Streptomyces fagopyri]|uniref:peptidoglycan-binding protein n=1 Tax=Streptomyces fagopyri TaxID=2662397 RepID=UPI003F4D181B